MSKDPNPPDDLRQYQNDFFDAITKEFIFTDEGVDFALDEYRQRLVDRIIPLEKLSSRERLLTYNQQYWFRLFTTMQNEFPLLCNLLGYEGFNRLVSGYLTKHMSSSFSLTNISNDLFAYIDHSAIWSELPILKEAARLEMIHIESFDALQLNGELQLVPITPEDIHLIEDSGLTFQPSCFFFHEHWDLVASRMLAMQQIEADDDIIKEITPKEKESFWCIYRRDNLVEEEPLSPIQFKLLELLTGSCSMDEALVQMEDSSAEEELQEIEQGISSWFMRWVSLGWFVLPKD